MEKAWPATVNQRLTALKRFFAWAVRQGHARSDPTADISGLRLPQRQPKALTEREVRRFLRAVHAEGNPRDIALVEMLLGTGIRVGELLALRVGDVVIRDMFATRYLAANPSDLQGLAALQGHTSLNTVIVYMNPRLGDLAEKEKQVRG